jgi:hypothetical protein
MVVPYCYQCSPGAQPALLTIANAYIAPAFGGLNLVRTRSTASPYLQGARDAVERVLTIPRRLKQMKAGLVGESLTFFVQVPGISALSRDGPNC